MAERRAFITGITGQDGSYLAEQLLEEDYEVGGLIRSSSTGHLGNVEHLRSDIRFYRGSLEDAASIEAAVSDFKPHEVYNLGAEAAPFDSFRRPDYTSNVNYLGAIRVFDAARNLSKSGHSVRVYQASTSEMYGEPPVYPQDEETLLKPNNPYAIAKRAAHDYARMIRESSEHFPIACGILFNHESPRRGMQYVTRKISVAVACIANRVKNPPLDELGRLIVIDGKLHLGNLKAQRDWGYSKDYVRAMRLILQHDPAEDFVIATGETHSVGEFAKNAFKIAHLDMEEHVVIDHDLIRPLETGPLCGNFAKAKRILGWSPDITFNGLVEMMVQSDLAKFS